MKKNLSTVYIVRTGLLLALALVFQIGLSRVGQTVVGPLVNFTLIISAGLVGMSAGIIVGCLTPIIAYFFGIMPLFPLVPFIIIGNSILVILFSLIKNKIAKGGDFFGVFVAAIGKFAFLAVSVRYLVGLFVPKVPAKLITALSLPQLYSALVGGILALVIMKFLPKSVFLKNK